MDERLSTRTARTTWMVDSTGLLDSIVSSRTRHARVPARRTVAIGSAATIGASHKTATIRYRPEKRFSRYNRILLTAVRPPFAVVTASKSLTNAPTRATVPVASSEFPQSSQQLSLCLKFRTEIQSERRPSVRNSESACQNYFHAVRLFPCPITRFLSGSTAPNELAGITEASTRDRFSSRSTARPVKL